MQRRIFNDELLLQLEALRGLPIGRRRPLLGSTIRLAAVVVLLVQVNLSRYFGEDSEGGPVALLYHGQVDRRPIGLSTRLGLLALLESLRGMAHARKS